MKKYLFGIDVGGTTIKIGLFQDDNTLCYKEQIATNTSNHGSEILPDITKACKIICEERDILWTQIIGIGIGIPGPIDKNGMVNQCINLGWKNFPISYELEQLAGVPVYPLNDANAAALGEWGCGKGKNFHNLVLFTLGTGVGGGVIVQDHIVPGAFGTGGEFGHLHVKDGEKEPCGCGRYGCLEQYSSATALVRKVASKNIKVKNAKEIFDAAKSGNEQCIAAVEEFCKRLAMAMADISCVIGPEIILVGGGVSRAGNYLLDMIRYYFNQYCFSSCNETRIEIASLGNDAGMYGVAYYVTTR